ncbi:MAG: hypothetical protein LBL00_07835 [Endomicrobium sp.]|jgi:hypothetical protein|nr:hypothetical protein [Endomicrobium sp.]
MSYKTLTDTFIGGEFRKAGFVVAEIPKGLDKKHFEETKKEKPAATTEPHNAAQPPKVPPEK